MKQADITICGKQAKVAYCYATEIAYKDFTGEDIHTFMSQANEDIQSSKMPDTKKSIYLILSAIMAYYQFKGDDAPITDKELMTSASPQDFGAAIGTIIGLYNQFYTLPAGELADKQGGNRRRRKNS